MWINLFQKSTIVPNLRLTIHKNASSKNQAHEQELQEMHIGSRPPFAIHSLMRVHGTTCALVAYFVSLPRVMVVACCLTTRVPQKMVCSGVQDRSACTQAPPLGFPKEFKTLVFVIMILVIVPISWGKTKNDFLLKTLSNVLDYKVTLGVLLARFWLYELGRAWHLLLHRLIMGCHSESSMRMKK